MIIFAAPLPYIKCYFICKFFAHSQRADSLNILTHFPPSFLVPRQFAVPRCYDRACVPARCCRCIALPRRRGATVFLRSEWTAAFCVRDPTTSGARTLPAAPACRVGFALPSRLLFHPLAADGVGDPGSAPSSANARRPACRRPRARRRRSPPRRLRRRRRLRRVWRPAIWIGTWSS